MKWFGEPWPSEHNRAPICEDDEMRTETPVGEECLWCHEPIEEGDRGITMMEVVEVGHARTMPLHIECDFRQVMGGPAHIQGTCSCQGGTDDPDLGLAPREAAKLVWNEWAGYGL